jgi:hypothetical protein
MDFSIYKKSLVNNCLQDFIFNNGVPDRSRTCDLMIRSHSLYPAELRAQIQLQHIATINIIINNKKIVNV